MQQALEKLRGMQDSHFQKIVDAYVEEAIRVTGSKIGYFALLNWGEDTLTMMGWSKSAMEACMSITKPIIYKVEQTGLWGDCVRQRKAVITNDYASFTSPTKKGYPKGHVEVIRHMNVPVQDGNRIRGILGVGNKTGVYSETDSRRLQDFADQAWKFVEKALKL